MKKITIAIDGYSSTGKSTLAKELSDKLSYVYVDSGAMYRAVTLYLLRKGLLDNDAIDTSAVIRSLPEIDLEFRQQDSGKAEMHLNGEHVETQIREMAVSSQVSRVSAIAEVRVKMVELQQQMGLNKAIVMDGRDIGSVVFPTAELKLFMTAEPMVRARRRFDELVIKGTVVTFEEVLENLEKRDLIDTTREESPLIQTSDAIVIDNSELTRQEQLTKVLDLVAEKLK